MSIHSVVVAFGTYVRHLVCFLPLLVPHFLPSFPLRRARKRMAAAWHGWAREVSASELQLVLLGGSVVEWSAGEERRGKRLFRSLF